MPNQPEKKRANEAKPSSFFCIEIYGKIQFFGPICDERIRCGSRLLFYVYFSPFQSNQVWESRENTKISSFLKTIKPICNSFTISSSLSTKRKRLRHERVSSSLARSFAECHKLLWFESSWALKLPLNRWLKFWRFPERVLRYKAIIISFASPLTSHINCCICST